MGRGCIRIRLHSSFFSLRRIIREYSSQLCLRHYDKWTGFLAVIETLRQVDYVRITSREQRVRYRDRPGLAIYGDIAAGGSWCSGVASSTARSREKGVSHICQPSTHKSVPRVGRPEGRLSEPAVDGESVMGDCEARVSSGQDPS